MAYDYDKLYGETPDALGPPTRQFVDFFDGYSIENKSVLDVGCGQGRDAVFIARLGANVIGVDLSPNGIDAINAVAKREGLSLQGIVANLETFTPTQNFDVVVIDRTLHMLNEEPRLAALDRLLECVRPAGWVLIADEASNMAGFKGVIADHSHTWQAALESKGYLFVHRT